MRFAVAMGLIIAAGLRAVLAGWNRPVAVPCGVLLAAACAVWWL
jgi:hypothetical protein